MKPTGDKDPFGLRRAALGALRIMREHSLNIDLHELLSQSRGLLADCIDADFSVDQVYDFMIERLKGIYTEQGTGLDLFAAVAAVRPTSVLDFDQRLTAVSEFQQLPASEVLAAANKRIRNILKKVDGAVPSEVDASLFEESEEQRLYDQIQAMSEQVGPMMQGRDYAPVLKTLADLREPVDAFFDKVLVMADNEAVKNNRLAMLSAMNSLFMEVADVSQLQQN
jgi:glycyl-tRNA synthetase beta chain